MASAHIALESSLGVMAHALGDRERELEDMDLGVAARMVATVTVGDWQLGV